MFAMDRGRVLGRMAMALVVVGTAGTGTAFAMSPPARTGQAPAPQAESAKGGPAEEAPYLKAVRLPVNPSDPVAVVNNEAITRQQLADECVARKGEEILETLIARKLIDQEIRKRHLTVTPEEVSAEIDRMADRMGKVNRETFLRALAKDRGISPSQLANDIVYPTLALRKLAQDKVQVTQQDLKDAFEANFGEKLRCRVIMVEKIQTAKEIWEELKQNPGGFEKIAQERSIDQASRSVGGLVPPITRHADPRTVSDAAFAQLVDGDEKDKDPAHKPKDGDFTGPIQGPQSTYLIMKREEVIPATPGQETPETTKALKELIFEAKVKDQMSKVYEQMLKAAAIDNKLTGQIKSREADEQASVPDQDREVKLMSNPGREIPPPPTAPKAAAGVSKTPKRQTPVGLNPEDAKRAESFKHGLNTPK